MLYYFKPRNRNRNARLRLDRFYFSFKFYAHWTQTEREREREQNSKYAIGCRSDPFAALRRDAVYELDVSPDAGAGGAQTAESADGGAADEELAQANAEIEALPLHRLDALIQRHTRERLQLTRRVDELDAKYSKVRAHFLRIPFHSISEQCSLYRPDQTAQ